MVMRTLIRQTMLLSASHFFVRVLGFLMRIWLSRSLGPQAMGLVELASSAQMLLITPVTSGLPAAISRMCAKADSAEQGSVVRCGASLSLAVSLPIMAAAYLLREPIALWLGDVRTLPALIVYLPCIPVLALSCAFNGYFYGSGRPLVPALGEILEQVVRFLLCIYLTTQLAFWPLMLRAAIPGAAALAGESVSLLLLLALAFRIFLPGKRPLRRQGVMREIFSLALPLTGMRLVSSLMRTINTLLIPARLVHAGVTRTQALTGLGMINGMMMPILMAPSFITISLSMAVSPELTRRQAQGKPVSRLIRRMLSAALVIGMAAAAAIYAAAPLISSHVFRQSALLPLLRRSCLLVPVMSLGQVTGGMMNALGLQGRSLRIALCANLLSVLLMYVLAAHPAIHLYGAIIAMAAGHLLTLCMNLRILRSEGKQDAGRVCGYI